MSTDQQGDQSARGRRAGLTGLYIVAGLGLVLALMTLELVIVLAVFS